MAIVIGLSGQVVASAVAGFTNKVVPVCAPAAAGNINANNTATIITIELALRYLVFIYPPLVYLSVVLFCHCSNKSPPQ